MKRVFGQFSAGDIVQYNQPSQLALAPIFERGNVQLEILNGSLQINGNFYLGTLYRTGTFHADPHPGNYHFREDGRVVVFDYGCVREFRPAAVQAFVELADAVRADDRARIHAALRRLGAEPTPNDAAYVHLRQLLRSFFGPMLRAGPRRVEGRIVVDMKQVMRDKLALMKLRLPGRFMFLFRIRFGLYAVLSRLGSVCDWASMEQRFAEESAAIVPRAC